MRTAEATIEKIQQNYISLIEQSKSRLLKGYYFERLVGEVLNSLGVPYRSNPIESFSLWLFNTASDHDLVVFNEKIEVKYNSPNTRLYKSYLKRDWLPRASLIITNDDSPIWRNKKLLRYLKRNGKKVLSLSKFIMWVKRRVKRKIRSSITSNMLEWLKIKIKNIAKAMGNYMKHKMIFLIGSLNKPPPDQENVAFLSSDNSSSEEEEIETIRKELRLYPSTIELQLYRSRVIIKTTLKGPNKSLNV